MVVRLLFFFFSETDHVSYLAKDAYTFLVVLLEKIWLVILCDLIELDFLQVGHLDKF